MSYFAALFSHRDPTPVRRVTLGALSLVLGGKNERALAQPDPPPGKADDNSARPQLTGASLQLRADPAVPFLATLAPVILAGSAASTQPHLRPAALRDSPQPLASCGALISSGLGLA